MRSSGSYTATTTLGEVVRAFVPHALPPARPALAPESYNAATRDADLALARLSAVAGLVPSVDWLLYGAIRKEALLTSQIEGTQATLADLFDDEAGLAISNADTPAAPAPTCTKPPRPLPQLAARPSALPFARVRAAT